MGEGTCLTHPSIKPEEEHALFDPIYCAELHNKIVQKVLELRPDLSSQLVHGNFLIPHTPIYIDWSNWDINRYPHTKLINRPSPSTIAQLQARLGPELTTFLQKIDCIVFTNVNIDESPPVQVEHEHNLERRDLFLPDFDNPDINRLFDHTNKFRIEEYTHLRHVICLYPQPELGAYHGGIMFDLYTKLAMYLDPDTDMSFLRKDQSNWVPLDVILRHWLQLFEQGKFYVEETEIKEHEYAQLELDRDLQAWEDYLEVLEAKVLELRSTTNTKLRADRNDDVVSEEKHVGQLNAKLIQAAIEQNKLDPIGPVLLSRLRRPNHGIKYIGSGLVCFDDALFSKMYSVTSSTTAEVPDDFPLLYPGLERKPNLIFPAIGPCSTLELGDNYMIWPWNAMGKFPGVWALADRGSRYTVLDHKGGQDIFHSRDMVPWDRPSSPLADMFRAWKAMLVNGYWEVNHDGIVGDYSWFAENRNMSWREVTIWGDIEDADGDMLEMSNDWIGDLLSQGEGAES